MNISIVECIQMLLYVHVYNIAAPIKLEFSSIFFVQFSYVPMFDIISMASRMDCMHRLMKLTIFDASAFPTTSLAWVASHAALKSATYNMIPTL